MYYNELYKLYFCKSNIIIRLIHTDIDIILNVTTLFTSFITVRRQCDLEKNSRAQSTVSLNELGLSHTYTVDTHLLHMFQFQFSNQD